MRKAQSIITELSQAGVVLQLDGHNLKFRAPKGTLTAERIDLLRTHKAAIIAALTPQAMPALGHVDPAELRVQTEERIAICVTDGIPLAEAERTAEVEIGISLDALAELQVADWRRRIEALSEPADSRLARIKPVAIGLLTLPWVLQAARYGVTGVELFGLQEAAPLTRLDARGVVCGIALASWPLTVAEVGRKHDRFETATGASLSQPWRLTGPGVAVWDHPAFNARRSEVAS